jgi:hypothetical protein
LMSAVSASLRTLIQVRSGFVVAPEGRRSNNSLPWTSILSQGPGRQTIISSFVMSASVNGTPVTRPSSTDLQGGAGGGGRTGSPANAVLTKAATVSAPEVQMPRATSIGPVVPCPSVNVVRNLRAGLARAVRKHGP